LLRNLHSTAPHRTHTFFLIFAAYPHVVHAPVLLKDGHPVWDGLLCGLVGGCGQIGVDKKKELVVQV